jgi:TonB family protein
MSPWTELLLTFWTATLSHLWQSTIVLALLGLLGLTLRNAPGRIRNGLWQIGLIKLMVPFSLLGLSMPTWRPGGEAISESVTVTLVSGIWNPAVLSNPPEAESPVLPVTITVLWAITALWLLTRGATVWIPKRYRRGIDLSDLDPATREKLRRVMKRAGIRQQDMHLSFAGTVPGVSGFLHPRIHLSVDLLRSLDEETLRAVLLHENAHRRRYEPLRYGIQRTAFCLFFYFPPLWFLLRQLHDSSELACDEAALEQGADPAAYLAALKKVVALDLAPATTLAAMAGGRPSFFARRLDAIKKYQRRSVMTKHRIALAAGLVILSVSAFMAGAPDKDRSPLLPGVGGIGNPVIISDSKVQPAYPETARKSKVNGTVILQCVINEDGTVGEISIKKEDPAQFEFGDAAIEAVRQWRYEPALKDGKPVAVYMTILVEFKLDGNKPGKETPVS